MEMSLTVTLPEEFLKDVLVTICESGSYGIGYWAQPGKVLKGTSNDYTKVRIAYDRDDEPEGTMGGVIEFGLEEVAKGIKTILQTEPTELALHKDNIGIVAAAVLAQDAGDIDGDAADWIAQAAIFGKVIYG